MGSFTKLKRGVRILHVWADNAHMAMEILNRHLLASMVNPKEYDRAVLCDTGSPNGNSEDPSNYTLKFESRDRTEALWISGLTAGPKCFSSEYTVQALMLMGFNPNPERDVYQLAKGERKVFKKK